MEKSVMSYFSMHQLVEEVIKRIGDIDGADYLSLEQLRGLVIICSTELARRDKGGAACYDCGRQYGHEHGFPDLVIPNYIWKRISPSGNEGGLLCPSCICKRLHEAGIYSVEGAFMSGPIESVSRPTMYALRRAENLEERLNRAEKSTQSRGQS